MVLRIVSWIRVVAAGLLVVVWLGVGYLLGSFGVFGWFFAAGGYGGGLFIVGALAFVLWALYLWRVVRGARKEWKQRGGR